MKPSVVSVATDPAHKHLWRRMPLWMTFLHPRLWRFWLVSLPLVFVTMVAVLLFARWPGDFKVWHEFKGGWAWGCKRWSFNTPTNHESIIGLGPLEVGRTSLGAPLQDPKAPLTTVSKSTMARLDGYPPPPVWLFRCANGVICTQYGFKGGISSNTDDCVYLKLKFN